MPIQIMIADEVWDYLNKQKKRGESFNEVLVRLLKIKGGKRDGKFNKIE